MGINLKIMGSMHTGHPSPLGLDVVVFHEAHRTFHVVQEKFAIDAERTEQAVVEIKRKRSVIGTFGIVSLFHEQGDHRNKKPWFQVVILNLKFANAESGIAHSQFVAVAKNVAGFVLVLVAHARIDAQVPVERHHTQGAKLHVK